MDISHNSFRQLFAGVFRGLRRLECLVLSDGQLKYLDEHAFDGLEMLNELILNNNQLSSIYLELFQSISNIHVSYANFLRIQLIFANFLLVFDIIYESFL